ncbi:POTRA domain-containing protein [Thermovibrio sp.]
MRVLLLSSLLSLLLASSVMAEVVERIEISGLRWTKKELVLKELLLKPGQEFSQKLLKLSIRNLLNTHLFYKVESKVIEDNGKVIIKLKLKDKFPLVPLPRFQLKSSGAYKAGMEVRDYNLLGLGHKVFAGYVRWFNESLPSKKLYTYTELYRIIENRGNLSFGLFYNESYGTTREGERFKEKLIRAPLKTTFYLDREKVKQLSAGIESFSSLNSGSVKDTRLQYLTLSFLKDKSTDMVYYTVGRKEGLSIKLSAPGVSDFFTGEVLGFLTLSKRKGSLTTYAVSAYGGTKVGYSREGLYLRAPLPGYSTQKLYNKRFLAANYSYRFSLIDKSVFLKPTLWVGSSFKNRPRKLLSSVGFELTAFWARIADGIIKFKIFRGIGNGGETESSFRLSFRW